MPITLLLKKNRALFLPGVIFGGRFKMAVQKFIYIFARFSTKIVFPTLRLTVFDSQIRVLMLAGNFFGFYVFVKLFPTVYKIGLIPSQQI